MHDTVAAIARGIDYRRSLRQSVLDRLFLWLAEAIAHLVRFIRQSPVSRPLGYAVLGLIVLGVVARLVIAAQARDETGGPRRKRTRRHRYRGSLRRRPSASRAKRGTRKPRTRSITACCSRSRGATGCGSTRRRRAATTRASCVRAARRRTSPSAPSRGDSTSPCSATAAATHGSSTICARSRGRSPRGHAPRERSSGRRPRAVRNGGRARASSCRSSARSSCSSRCSRRSRTRAAPATHGCRRTSPARSAHVSCTRPPSVSGGACRSATTRPRRRAGDGRTIHAVLAPPLPVTPEEAHAYLEAVRAGDALLLTLDARNALSDSLGVSHSGGGGHARPDRRGRGELPARDGAHPAALARRQGAPLVAPLETRGAARSHDLRRRRRPMARRSRPGGGEIAAGFPLGRGRVVVVSDPDLLRNDVMRRCRWAADVRAVRMLEWLRDGGDAPRTTLVFDEYHQGYGAHARRCSAPPATSSCAIRSGARCCRSRSPRSCCCSPSAPRPIPAGGRAARRAARSARADRRARARVRAGARDAHDDRAAAARRALACRARLVRHARPRRRGVPRRRGAPCAGRSRRTSSSCVAHSPRRCPTARLPELGAALRRIEHTLTTTPTA